MPFHPYRHRAALAVGGIGTAAALVACGQAGGGSSTTSDTGTTSTAAGGATATQPTSDGTQHASSGRGKPTVIASYDRGNRDFRVLGRATEQGYCIDVRADRPPRQQCDPVPAGEPHLQVRTFDAGSGEGYLAGIVDDPAITDVDLIANDGSRIVEDAENFELVGILDGRARAFAPVRGPMYYQAVVAKDAEGNTVARQPVGDSGRTGEYSTGDKSGQGSATATDPAKLTDVKLARREGTDAVRLRFAPGSGTPDFEIGYAPAPLHLEGSGKPVSLEGGRAVSIDLTNAVDGDISAGDVLLDPARQSVIAQAKSLGAFEGHVSLGIGLVGDEKIPFRVTTTDNTITIEFDYGPPENG